jgi:peptide/nickel transport system ATP-binding protein
MYLGRIVEEGEAETVFRAPRHPYTQALVSAVPGTLPEERILLTGDPPSPEAVPAGCRFHPRCPKVFEPCRTLAPQRARSARSEVECHLYAPALKPSP